MVLSNNGRQWAQFVHREEQWQDDGGSDSINAPNPITVPLFPRASVVSNDRNGNGQSRIIQFTQKQVDAYLDECIGFGNSSSNSNNKARRHHSRRSSSSSSSNHSANWFAIYDAIEQAIEGVASFEFYPNTTDQGTRDEWLFVSVHKPSHTILESLDRQPVKYGWLFKQAFPSVGIWTTDFGEFMAYRRREKVSSQYARSPLPIAVDAGFAKTWLPFAKRSPNRGHKPQLDQNVLDWVLAAKAAGLSTCPMPAYRLDADKLAWHSKPHVLGVGGLVR